jgi:tetratricopeptide (TPR) repeat protein
MAMNAPAAARYADAVNAFNAGDVHGASVRAGELPFLDAGIASDADFNLLLAAIEQAFGKTHVAQEHLLQAFGRAPRRADIAERLGQLYMQLGNLREGIYFLQRARRLSRTLGREDVLVFGDSHSDFCFGGVPRCKVHWLGPMTMHRVGRDGLAALDARQYGAGPGKHLVFIFGEIDIRAHVGEQCERQGRAQDEVLHTLCEAYVECVVQNLAQSSALSATICSVPPPMVCENNAEVPFRSSLAERIVITRTLNQQLAVQCQQRGLHYLDIYRYFSNPAGHLVRGFSDQVVHIRREFCEIMEYELESVLFPS